MKDMVVILPGITGSVLQKDGKDLWGTSLKTISSIVFSGGKSLQQLKLAGTDSGGIEYGDGVKATRLVNDAQLIPGLIKIVDGYSTISKRITDHFKVTPGDIYHDPETKSANFYHFPYDWRRDNRINGKILNQLINQRLKTWRESSGHKNAKVILLAHSMGGLVARYHLEVLGGWQDCCALFTFGTPYRGSVNAVNFLANGLKKGFVDLTEVMRSLPAAYQLLPIYSMLQVGNEDKRIAEVGGLPHIDQGMAQDALAFHREIEAAVKTNLQDSRYHEQFATVPFVGVQQPTLQSAELQDGKIKTSRKLPRIMEKFSHLGDGDSTVPKISAFPLEFSDQDILTVVGFIAEKHGSLQSQPDILLSLLNKLQLSETLGSIEDIRGVGDEKARSIKGTSGISLDVADLYFPDESEVLIKAQVNSGGADFGGLRATIECLSDAQPALNLDFAEDSGGFSLKPEILNSQPGLYRIKVQTKNTTDNSPNAVHDLFEVADIT